MNNLRKFATEAAYSAATLNYPAVSWVVSGDTVHYDKEAPSPKGTVTICQSGAGTEVFGFYNCGASLETIESITFDGVNVTPLTCSTETDTYDTVTAVYTLKGTTVGEEFTGDIGFNNSSSRIDDFEMMLSEEITSIEDLPSKIKNLVCLATTPPTLPEVWDWSFPYEHPTIYVKDDSLSAYQEAEGWGGADEIKPLSYYEGNLPIN